MREGLSEGRSERICADASVYVRGNYITYIQTSYKTKTIITKRAVAASTTTITTTITTEITKPTKTKTINPRK